MLKRIIASMTTVAALSSVSAAPAFAATGTIEGTQCRITLTSEEYAAVYNYTAGRYVDGLVTIVSIEDAQDIVRSHYYFPTTEQDDEIRAILNSPTESQERKEEARQYFATIYPVFEAFRNCAKGKETQPQPENALSSEDGKPNEAGIGLIVGGVILAILGLVAAAVPVLPAQLRALLPV